MACMGEMSKPKFAKVPEGWTAAFCMSIIRRATLSLSSWSAIVTLLWDIMCCLRL